MINPGEGGIRTLGTVASTQHFQCCTIGRSVTSPYKFVKKHKSGREGEIRTLDLRFRKPLLYPAELLPHRYS